jgi:hypothetical protein
MLLLCQNKVIYAPFVIYQQQIKHEDEVLWGVRRVDVL